MVDLKVKHSCRRLVATYQFMLNEDAEDFFCMYFSAWKMLGET